MHAGLWKSGSMEFRRSAYLLGGACRRRLQFKRKSSKASKASSVDDGLVKLPAKVSCAPCLKLIQRSLCRCCQRVVWRQTCLPHVAYLVGLSGQLSVCTLIVVFIDTSTAVSSLLINKKHLKNVWPIRHCEPPHAACPQRRRRQQRQRVTEGTAMVP